MFAAAFAIAAAHQIITCAVAFAIGTSFSLAINLPRTRVLHPSIRKH